MTVLRLNTERQRRLWEQVEPLLAKGDLAHDILHTERVFRWANRLSMEAGVNSDLAGAAALVHDLVQIPKEDPERSAAGERSADAAAGLLEQAGYRPEEIEEIVQAVRTSSWSSGMEPTSDLGRVLQDADRLDAIGAIGIARAFCTAQSMAHGGQDLGLYDPSDPRGKYGRGSDDRKNALDHFTVKLMGLAGGMHFPGARQEAERRHQTMTTFLEEMVREITG
ncbi:MAG: HD domain-containing protein [Bradymonadales bacterium]|nr:HD domain-containing protein [Bradymonadales bacterium]